MYYHSINLDFGQNVDPAEFLGKHSFETVKNIANSLGVTDLRSFFSAFSGNSFHWNIPDRLELFTLKFDRTASLENARESNGSLSWYGMAKKYYNNASAAYGSFRSKSKLRLSTIFSILPEDCDICSILAKIEDKAEKKSSRIMNVTDEYFYEGIPSTVFIATWMKELATGIPVDISRTYLVSAFDSQFMNPKISTLCHIAEYWGMGTNSFIAAIEQGTLILAPEDSPIIGDNSKLAIIDRIIDMTAYSKWHELALSFPEERKIAVRNLYFPIDSDLNVYTLLSILRPFGLKLSDVIE